MSEWSGAMPGTAEWAHSIAAKFENVASLGVTTPEVEDDGFHMVRTDLANLGEVVPINYLYEPYLPEHARVWAWGPTYSAKSMFAMWLAGQLTLQGKRVVFISQENPWEEERNRLARIRKDPELFDHYHWQGVDLTQPEWVAEVLRVAEGTACVFLDTLTATWEGDEGDNRAMTEFDKSVQIPLVQLGASVFVIHHTGHAGMIRRSAATKGRGATAMGQKADGSLDFTEAGEHMFHIEHGKARIGGVTAPKQQFRIVDAEDGMLDIEAMENTRDANALQSMLDDMVAVIRGEPKLSTTELQRKVRGDTDRKKEAISVLLSEAGKAQYQVTRVNGKKNRKEWLSTRDDVQTESGLFSTEVRT